MKKKVALALAGFVRGEENIEEIKKYIINNKDYEFYNFIVVYDKMGTKTRAYQGGQTETEIVNVDTFLSFKYESIKIKKYTEVVKFIKKLIDDNIDKLDSVLPFKMSKTDNIIQLHNIISRWYMTNLSLKLISETNINFDYVIQARFDLKSDSLEKIKNIKKNIVCLHFKNENDIKYFNNREFKLSERDTKNLLIDITKVQIPFGGDLFFYYSFKNLIKMIKITEIDYFLSCLKNEELKLDFKKVKKNILCGEFFLMMILIINNFKFRNLRKKPIINRDRKLVKNSKKFKNYFNINIYISWVNFELNKIPILKKRKKKNFTLQYVLDKITNKNYNSLEFGVNKGETLKMISKHVKKLYGFDSFESFPKVDNNVELIQGSFQDTLDNFLKNHQEDFNLIHIDCDLYSNTKYIFNKLIEYKKLKKDVIIVFDEIINYNKFLEGELKALFEINTQNGIKFEWIGTHGNIIFPKDLEDENNKFNKWSFKQYRKNGYQQEAAIIIL